MVTEAQRRGWDAWGVDTYADGFAALRDAAPAERVRRIAPDAPLPFEAASFDIVLSNQVFEHIAEPRRAIGELARVLRPGGRLIALFPTREVLIEPHLRVPLAHWLPTGSRAQRRALAACHLLGLCHDPAAPREAWVESAVAVLQHAVFLRRIAQAEAQFEGFFFLEQRAEAAFLRDRLAHAPRLARFARLLDPPAFERLLRFAALRLAGTTLVLRRAGA